jgi:LacI family transcriptional regulator
MQQVADAAGVSKSAVSLALRNDPRIPEATRRRIHEAAERLGYRRNPIVDALMVQLQAGRQPTFQANLALINCSKIRDLRKNHTFRRLREGVLRRADQLGYGVEEYWLEQPDLRPERLKQILETRGIRGLILIAALSPDAIHTRYDDFWKDFSCAVLGVTHLKNKLHCATNDQFLTARRATEEILRRGYRRPVLLVPPDLDELLDNKFSAGFISALGRLPRKDKLAPLPLDLARPEKAVEGIRRLKPDVVLTNRDEVHAWLVAAGFDIPAELGLVHLDWHEEVAGVAGMRQNNRVVGSAGADLVISQLQKHEVGEQEFPKVVQIESVWIDGPSVRDPDRRVSGKRLESNGWTAGGIDPAEPETAHGRFVLSSEAGGSKMENTAAIRKQIHRGDRPQARPR